MKGLYKVCHRIFAYPFRFIFNIRVHGKENEPVDDKPYIVCVNHMTAGDPVYVSAALKRKQLHYMAKAELFNTPVLRFIIRKLGAFPVQRGVADMSSLRTTFELIKNNECVAVFPQGTRQNGKDPLTTPIKPGIAMIALKSGADVLPVYIKAKNNRSGAFRRKDIYIGKTINNGLLQDMYENENSYVDIAKYIFTDLCNLGSHTEAY